MPKAPDGLYGPEPSQSEKRQPEARYRIRWFKGFDQRGHLRLYCVGEELTRFLWWNTWTSIDGIRYQDEKGPLEAIRQAAQELPPTRMIP